jgi:hypothetical protein
VLVFRPRVHHERIVDGHARDVDASLLELGEFLDVARQMFGRAGRRERARQAFSSVESRGGGAARANDGSPTTLETPAPAPTFPVTRQ